MEMKIGQRCLIAGERGQEQLLPERRVFVPPRTQFVTLAKSNALDVSGTERCDDDCNSGRDSEHLGGGAQIRARRVPGKGNSFDRELARRFSRKEALHGLALRLGDAGALRLFPPLQIVKLHLEERKWALGRAASRSLIEFRPKIPECTHDLKRFARLRGELRQLLQGAIVEGKDEIECLRASPFPGGQGIGRVAFVSSHTAIVVGLTRAPFQGLSGFVSNTPLSQRSASWTIGLEEN